ncbi:predicted protein [Thalassiosira pseudonana CCMP1335]|uniref:Esterase n=1 Tax=Thalassiosira pseudonana TaxID=35128 RepID=B8BZG5_THAPS|nr:predicted protein [Thalassiosira pseudonana CCMP1335]EED93349.1 predicted protein [Thalassiosira pseudonana CCMP1335]
MARPLLPPFPDGPCGGSVVTLPSRDLYGKKNDGGTSFLSSFNPLSSLNNIMLPPRDVLVWLPKEYHMPEYRGERFQVLYCHDGQNAMTDTSSWTGSSWRLIGAITRLSERKMLRSETPPIVVMIPSGEGGILPGMNMPGMNRRHAEYGDMGTVISEAHGEFVAKTLHPYVMERFRTKDGPEHTATIGSSLGGQSSLQLVLRHPEIFGGAACLSPCFQAGTIASVVANLVGNSDTSSTRYNKQDDANHRSLRSKTIYLDNGGDVDETRVPVFDAMDHFTMNERWWNPGYFWLDTQLQPTIDAVRWALDRGGVEYHYKKFPGARHNERAWATRIHYPLMSLYGDISSDNLTV